MGIRVVANGANSNGANGSGSSARTLRAPTTPLHITKEAASRLKALLAKKPGALGVKLGVRTRGCNGQSYTMNYAEEGELGKFDESVEEHGVRVFIEPRALLTVVGTTMDWKEDDISAEFVFHNPNATAVCGCGESYSI